MTEPKKTDAWMPLWIGDYLADTMSLTRDEHGAYLLLLFAYWRNKGPLKNDEKSLAATTRSTPLEWRKKLREKMEEFFEIQDAYLVHARADKELKKAGIYAMKAHDRAVKAAAARWGSKPDAKAMLDACPKHCSSNAQGVLDSCPSPSPSPSPVISIPTLVAKDETPSLSATPRAAAPSDAGLICRAMRAQGIPDCNPSSQALRTLIEAGATRGEFAAAAQKAASESKGFAYAVGIVTNERKRAAQMAQQIHRGQLPAAETAYQRSMRERMQEAAPDSARRDPNESANPVDFFTAIEVPARTVEYIK